MADSWQEIDDDGVIMDWTSADAMKGGHAWHYCEALRRALMECVKIGFLNYVYSIGASDTYGFYLANYCHSLVTNPLAKLTNIYSFMVAVDQVMLPVENSRKIHLHRRFFNHKKTPNLLGQGPLETWTDAEVLSDLGVESFIVPQKMCDIKPWLIERYKLLNLLRQATGEVRIGSALYKNVNHPGFTWSQILALFDATDWQAGNSDSITSFSDLYPGSTARIANYKTASIYFGASSQAWGVNYDDMAASGEAYFYGMDIGVESYGYTYGSLNKISIFNEKYFDPANALSTDEISMLPPIEPAVQFFDANLYLYGFHRNGLFKFDDANGRKFRGDDW